MISQLIKFDQVTWWSNTMMMMIMMVFRCDWFHAMGKSFNGLQTTYSDVVFTLDHHRFIALAYFLLLANLSYFWFFTYVVFYYKIQSKAVSLCQQLLSQHQSKVTIALRCMSDFNRSPNRYYVNNIFFFLEIKIFHTTQINSNLIVI